MDEPQFTAEVTGWHSETPCSICKSTSNCIEMVVDMPEYPEDVFLDFCNNCLKAMSKALENSELTMMKDGVRTLMAKDMNKDETT